MRITIALEDDALQAIRAYARDTRLSLGKAASELIRRGARDPLATRKLNGLPVFDIPGYFPVVTTGRVREFLDEE